MKKLLLLLFILNIRVCFACDCSFISIAEAYSYSDVVFKGKVIHKEVYTRKTIRGGDILPPMNFYKYTFFVDVFYKKNNSDEVKTIIIETPMHGTSCGINLLIGDSQFIFAKKGEVMLETSLCLRRYENNKILKRELLKLTKS